MLAIVAAITRGLTILAVWAGVAVGAAWLAWLAASPPSGAQAWIGRAVALALLLAPSAVLLLFVQGLREALEIPERARELPTELRGRTAELRERSRRSSSARGLVGTLASLFQLGRLVLGSRDVLTPYATVAVALRPAVLVAALIAAITAAIEIPVAFLALVAILLV